jgi:hypothetical protein
MARARLLKIGFFENEDLAQLPDKARLLFAGLWLLADRAGRLEDRPLRIRGQVFPYEMVDCDLLLEQLAGRGFIRRYVAGEHRIITIPKFLAHQNPHVREPESKLPAISQSLGSASASTGPAPGQHSSGPAVTDPVTDPVIDPESVKDRLSPSAPPRAKRSAKTGSDDPLFSKFWAAYPRKEAKPKALKAWQQISPDTALLGKMLDALSWQSRQPKWTKDRGEFIPHPASWLNGRRWEDEPFDAVDPTDAAWDEVESKIAARGVS